MESPTQTALMLAAQMGDRTVFEILVEAYQLVGLLVLSVVDEQIGSLIAFLDLFSLSSFALPDTFDPYRAQPSSTAALP